MPGAPAYVDTTGINAYDPARARALLKQAGQDLKFSLPLTLSLKLPPTPYARQGGELIAAQLAKVGITAKIENIEWAQWLSSVYAQRNYDLTLISHVEPMDLGNYAKPGYYWGYDNAAFKQLFSRLNSTPSEDEPARLLGDAQRLLAQDAVDAYLYQPLWITVAKRGVKGLWVEMPIFVNDIAGMSWE